MCGIVGAIAQQNVAKILLEGLQRLEYRGYDSAGLAVISPEGDLKRLRRIGKVKTLKEAEADNPLPGQVGIAHTRWATHGEPSESNAHPHISEYIAVVHNGIIENYQIIKTQLKRKGYQFTSETDTEVIAHLIHDKMKTSFSLVEAVKQAKKQLRGAYGMVVMSSKSPDQLIAARSGSPLVIGLGTNGNFIASDQLALLSVTRRFIFLDEGDIAEITVNDITIWDKKNHLTNREIHESSVEYNPGDKGLYRHYMQKEIFEQPEVIKNTLQGRLVHNEVVLTELGKQGEQILKQVEHIQIVACGTAYNAGFVARYWLESLTGIPCDVEVASEFRYRNPAKRKKSLFIALSQSGETADTLAALRLAKKGGYLSTLAICNVASSSLVRETDLVLLTKAGAEIGVASTKAFTTQLTVLLMLVAKLSRLHNDNKKLEETIVHALQALPSRIDSALLFDNQIAQLATRFADKHHTIFLGRGDEYPIAIEAALKLKEISYIHAGAYAAGELKHGPLALIDADMPVVVIAPKNRMLEKLKTNIEEVRARGGELYVFTQDNAGFTSDDTMKIIGLPHIEEITAPIYYTVPTQLLAYHIAVVKGTDVDQPKNLAKSVTVE